MAYKQFPAMTVGAESESAKCSANSYAKKEGHMFLILALVLIVAYVGGLVVFKGAGLAIHLLIIFAVISVIMHFVTGRKSA